MSKNQEWYKNYGVHLRGTPNYIMASEECIARVMSSQNLSRQDAINTIYINGIRSTSKDENLGSPKLEGLLANGDFFAELRQAQKQQKSLVEAYADLGAVEFQEIARRHGIDVDGFLNEYRMPVMSMFESIKRFIVNELEDYQPHSIDSLRIAAIERGLLPDPNEPGYDKTWQTFKQAASELNVSGKHTKRGEWQLVSKVSGSSK